MISSIRAIKIGKFTSITLFKNPYQYGYTIPNNPKEKKEEKERKTNTNQRAKQKILNLIKGNIYHHKESPVFMTLTLKENIQDLKTANRLFSKFIMRFNDYQKYQIRYVAVPEFQERGAVHYHTIVFNLPFTKASLIEQKIWKLGSVNMRLIQRQYGLFNYLTKYISKNFSDNRFKNKKRYFYSLENKEEVTLNQQKGLELYQQVCSDSKKVNEYIYEVKDKEDNVINQIKKMEFITL